MHNDPALALSNPRLLAAAYFSLLAVLITILMDTILYSIGITQLIPTFQAVLLAALFAACSGAIFGKKIIYCPEPYRRKAFLWGFLLVIAALPFYDVIFLYLLNKYHPNVLEGLSYGKIVLTYLFIITYSFILVGFWLALVSGFAAMYLRGHIVYDILDSKNDKLKEPRRKKSGAEDSRFSSPKK